MKPMELTIAGREALRGQMCSECGLIRAGSGAIDVEIEKLTLRRRLLNGVIDCRLPVARKDFLEMLGAEHVARDLYIGRVYCEGELLPDLVTVRGKCRVIVRGSKANDAGYRLCPRCGTPLYSARIGRRYLCPPPPAGIALFESDLAGVVMRDDVFPATLARTAGITYEKLRVLSSPEDDFADLVGVDCDR